ncbi:TPA: hypothetical protein HA265_05365 [Candidatus Woesearchaeota archaeon]|nr:hypothetical protein [Candidatus Woesearchaeota archaeon]
MKLYRLKPDVPLISECYARKKEDLEQLVESFDTEPMMFGLDYSGKLDKKRLMKQVERVSRGSIHIDFGGPVYMYKQHELPVLYLTEDFIATITYESVPYFPAFQQKTMKKRGELYRVIRWNGPVPFASFVPEDVHDALKGFDISPIQPAAMEHIAWLRSSLSQHEAFDYLKKVEERRKKEKQGFRDAWSGVMGREGRAKD